MVSTLIDRAWLYDNIVYNLYVSSIMDTFEDLQFRISCILNSGTHPDQILVSFDFDGTLGARRTSLSKNKTKDDPVTMMRLRAQAPLIDNIRICR